MLTVISPAKKLIETARELPEGIEMTEPAFPQQAMELALLARKLSVPELQKLSKISEALGRLNQDRFAAFSANPAPGSVFSAVHCFAGDTYQGLDARSMSLPALHHARDHLRILSGLYGLLRPFDGIQAYRLEMGSRLANSAGSDLHAYWANLLAPALNDLAESTGSETLVNCASIEYFGAVKTDKLRLRVITPVFLEEKDGETKIISFHAKRARGMMARYICENQLTNPADLLEFRLGGYGYQRELSNNDRLVFSRQDTSRAAA